MTDRIEPIGRILAPLINPNEPESQVVELGVRALSAISKGDLVCTLETSKATFEVESEYEGYVGSLLIELNDHVEAGQLICEVYEQPPPQDMPASRETTVRPAGLRLTRKAESLALEKGLDLTQLPTGRFLTEQDIREVLGTKTIEVVLDERIRRSIGKGSVLVFGGGGLGKSLIELMRAGGQLRPICIVDDRPDERTVLGVPLLGSRKFLPALREAGLDLAVNAVGAIGRIQDRIDIFRLLSNHGFTFPTLVDASASVVESANLGEGAQVFAGACVCSDARIGRGVIVNTGAIISHDCRVGDHSHIAPGAVLAGDVKVGEAVLVGMGVTTGVGVSIGDGSIIGNGSVVCQDVPHGTIVSAGSIWPHSRSGK